MTCRTCIKLKDTLRHIEKLYRDSETMDKEHYRVIAVIVHAMAKDAIKKAGAE